MFKDYEDLVRQMEFEMQRASAEAMRRLIELPDSAQEFWLPRTDVYETDTELVASVEVAGVCRDTLGVSLSSDKRTLTIRGDRAENCVDERKKTRYYQLEVYYGAFEREITLPRDVAIETDCIKAVYHDGFVVVSIPKSTSEPVTRSIPITGE